MHVHVHAIALITLSTNLILHFDVAVMHCYMLSLHCLVKTTVGCFEMCCRCNDFIA